MAGATIPLPNLVPAKDMYSTLYLYMIHVHIHVYVHDIVHVHYT